MNYPESPTKEAVEPVTRRQRPQPEPDENNGHWLRWFVVLAALGVIGIIVWRLTNRKDAAGARGALNQVVPVVVGTVQKKDVPIYLDGLGTVQAFNTVTVRARVDGQLTKINFVEGQTVQAGDVLAVIDQAPFKASLDQALAKKAQDEAQLLNAQIDLKRETELLNAKVDSQQLFDTQQALVRQLEAAVKADAAAIQSAQVQLDYTTISSPIAGRTGIRQVDAGNIINASNSNGIVVITQLKPISVVFTLPEQTLAQVRPRAVAGDLTVLAVERDNRTVLAVGKLAVVDNQIDTATGTIRLKATFDNEDLHLWPGQFVNARLLLSVRTNGLVVPSTVVQQGPEGSFAFVISGEDTNLTVHLQPIKVAQIEAGEALIDDGLAAGVHVVVDGQYRLQDGSSVRPSQANGDQTAGEAHAQAKLSTSGAP